MKNVFVEEWKNIGGDSSEEQNTIDAPVHITTMAHDDDSPAGADELYPKQHRGTSPTQLFRLEGKT